LDIGIIKLFIYHNNIIFFFTIFFGPGWDGIEDKIDGLDRAENVRPLQVYTYPTTTKSVAGLQPSYILNSAWSDNCSSIVFKIIVCISHQVVEQENSSIFHSDGGFWLKIVHSRYSMESKVND